MKESIRKATKRFQKPTYSGAGPRPSGALARPSGELGGLDKLFSKILPLQEPDEGLGRVLDPLRHALAELDLAARHPADQLGQRLRPELHTIGDDEALHLDAVGEQRVEVLYAVGLGRVV